MITKKNAHADATFLDMQADVGITKHIGGFEATNELLSLCHIEDAREVLNVGCGIGVGSTYIAKKYGCHGVAKPVTHTLRNCMVGHTRSILTVQGQVDIPAVAFRQPEAEATPIRVVFAAHSTPGVVELPAASAPRIERNTRPAMRVQPQPEIIQSK